MGAPKLDCVACGKRLAVAGKTLRCACGGAWVPESWLVDMAEQARGALVQLPWQDRSGAARGCPECKAAMQTVTLETVELDRCAEHGVWFDPAELPAVLAAAKRFPIGEGERATPLHEAHVPTGSERPSRTREVIESIDKRIESSPSMRSGGLLAMIGRLFD
jgi:Zn-finger nucleic acid-binding protein